MTVPVTMNNSKITTKAHTSAAGDVVLKQVQTAPNRRILAAMKSFRVDDETPQSMIDLLRRMERAEALRGS